MVFCSPCLPHQWLPLSQNQKPSMLAYQLLDMLLMLVFQLLDMPLLHMPWPQLPPSLLPQLLQPLPSLSQLHTLPLMSLDQMLSLFMYQNPLSPRKLNTVPGHILLLMTLLSISHFVETSTLLSQLSFWELPLKMPQSPVLARNPSLSTSQYQLKNHTMSHDVIKNVVRTVEVPTPVHVDAPYNVPVPTPVQGAPIIQKVQGPPRVIHTHENRVAPAVHTGHVGLVRGTYAHGALA